MPNTKTYTKPFPYFFPDEFCRYDLTKETREILKKQGYIWVPYIIAPPQRIVICDKDGTREYEIN